MIDYIALSLGHGLIAYALWCLFMRREVDFDPLIGGIQEEMRQNRMEASAAGRNAKRRKEAAATARESRRARPENKVGRRR